MNFSVSITRLATAVLCSLLLSACLLNRVTTVKSQLCDFDAYFRLENSETLALHMHEPVFLESDLDWFAGAAPSEITWLGDTKTLHYIVDKKTYEGGYTEQFRVQLQFRQIRDKQRLAAVIFDENMAAIAGQSFADPERMRASASDICQAGFSMASTRMTFELTEQDLAMLPERDQMEAWFGAPSEIITSGTEYRYEYRLRQPDGEAPVRASVTVWFPEAGGKPLRMVSTYGRYQTRADFVAREMSVKVNI